MQRTLNATPHFQAITDINVLEGLVDRICKVRVGDTIGKGRTQQEVLEHLLTVLLRLQGRKFAIARKRIFVSAVAKKVYLLGLLPKRGAVKYTRGLLGSDF